MKLWTLSTLSVVTFLAYSVTQYNQESTALLQEAISTEQVLEAAHGSKCRKAIDTACLVSELALRKKSADDSDLTAPTVGMAASIR